MKKKIVIVFCCLVLAMFPSCRKKSKSEKQLEKTKRVEMIRKQ